MEISLRQLTRVSATRTILQAIDLDFLGPGVNAVIGPNGAGKTSLLRLLALLEKPSSGEIRADGRPLTHLNSQERTAWRRRIGFVFQTPLLFRGTVQQNLLFGLKARGRSLSAAGIENLLGQVGLTQRNRQDVRQLSGGEKQRLQLARVLAFDPNSTCWTSPRPTSIR